MVCFIYVREENMSFKAFDRAFFIYKAQKFRDCGLQCILKWVKLLCLLIQRIHQYRSYIYSLGVMAWWSVALQLYSVLDSNPKWFGIVIFWLLKVYRLKQHDSTTGVNKGVQKQNLAGHGYNSGFTCLEMTIRLLNNYSAKTLRIFNRGIETLVEIPTITDFSSLAECTYTFPRGLLRLKYRVSPTPRQPSLLLSAYRTNVDTNKYRF